MRPGEISRNPLASQRGDFAATHAAILNALPAHIALIDHDGVIIAVNETWRRFAVTNGLGALHPGAGVGANYLELCEAAVGNCAVEAPRAAEGIRAVLNGTAREFSLEYPCHSPTAERWFRLTVTPLGENHSCRAAVMHIDITERRLAEDALRESNEKFHHLADNITDAFWIRSPDMRTVHYISPAFERIWGRPVQTLYSHPEQWAGFILPEDRERVLAAFAALGHDRRGVDLEYRITRPDDEIRWVHVRGFQVRDAADQLIRHIGIVTDITARKNAEHVAQQNEERMRWQAAALGAAINGVAITDRRGTIQWVNAAFSQLTGYPAEESIGRNPRLLKSGRHDEAFYHAMWQTIARGDPWKGEIVNRHKAGHLYYEEMTITPVRNSGGAITHFIAIQQDISERKQAEAAIEELHKKLLGASRAAGMAEIATNVLHNVGNVLNSVNVSATLVADHVRLSKCSNVAKIAALLGEHATDLATFLTTDPRGQTIPGYLTMLAASLASERAALLAELDHLRKNVGHIKEIVAMQQSYATNSGFIETVPIAELVEDALRMNATALARHDIELVRDFQVHPSISTDKHKVMQILVNIVRNAKIACDDAGRADKRITVRVSGAELCVRVAISDNGVGIAPENLTRIFAHGFTTRKNGHGFGLHSGALAARELGGTLSVHSDGSGHGATFTLELPHDPGTPNA